jgi:hypothetical protein
VQCQSHPTHLLRGAHTACRFIVELDAAAKDVQAVLQPMLASVPTPHFEGAGAQSGHQEDSERVQAAESHSGQMIVDSVSEDNSKIFLILQNDHAIFCEGEWEHTASAITWSPAWPLAKTLPLAQPLAKTLPLARPLAKTWPLAWPFATTLPLVRPMAKTWPSA